MNCFHRSIEFDKRVKKWKKKCRKGAEEVKVIKMPFNMSLFSGGGDDSLETNQALSWVEIK